MSRWTYYISNDIGTKRYEFKNFKVYWAYRDLEKESLKGDCLNSTAISFEKYLLSKGYKPYEYCYKKKQLIPMQNTFYYSTMMHLRSYYIHPDKPDEVFEIGLKDADLRQVTLLYPKPKIKLENEDGKDISYLQLAMSKAHVKYTDEQIYNAIYDKSIILDVNE